MSRLLLYIARGADSHILALHLLRPALALYHEVRLEAETDHEDFIALLYKWRHGHLNVEGDVRGAALQRVEADVAVPDVIVGPVDRESGD